VNEPATQYVWMSVSSVTAKFLNDNRNFVLQRFVRLVAYVFVLK